MGKVVEIQSRVTVLQAIDGTKVIVPNADLFKNQIISFTSNPFRRIEILVGVDYRNNLENVIRVLMHVLKTTEGVLLEPAPGVLVDEFAESSINLKVRAWVQSGGGWMKIKSNLVIRVKQAFDEYGITIPWPIRTIVYDKDQQYAEKMMTEEKIENAEVKQAEQFQVTQTNPVVAPQVVLTPAPVTIATDQPAPVTTMSHLEEQPLRPLDERR